MYLGFLQLEKTERAGRDFEIRMRIRDSGIVVMAPHGGGIEPGTSELAEAIAGTDYSYYIFEGLKKSGNWRLHIPSTFFDEPQALRIAQNTPLALALHGFRGSVPAVYVGGRAREMGLILARRLSDLGFDVRFGTRCRGLHRNNLCNRTMHGRGVQLELTRGLRLQLLADRRASAGHPGSGFFAIFVRVVRLALRECEEQL